MIVSPSACSRLVSAAPWYVEPGIASGSFIVWLLFFRACELGWGFLLRAPRQPARLAVSLFRRARRWLRRHRIQDAYPIKPARPSGRRASSPDCILAPEEQERTAEERQCSREQRQRSRERERERERERASDADSIEPPHAFTTHAFSSLGAYWLGILLWTRVVSPVTGAGTGCPTGAASTAQLVAEVVAGLVDTYAVSHCGVAHRPPPCCNTPEAQGGMPYCTCAVRTSLGRTVRARTVWCTTGGRPRCLRLCLLLATRGHAPPPARRSCRRPQPTPRLRREAQGCQRDARRRRRRRGERERLLTLARTLIRTLARTLTLNPTLTLTPEGLTLTPSRRARARAPSAQSTIRSSTAAFR